MIVYTEKNTQRLNYVFNYVLNERLGLRVQITNNVEEYNNAAHPKINYSNQLLDGLTIVPANLLFEQGINEEKPLVSVFNGMKILYAKESKAPLAFDVFAAVFWMLSRYEEYQPFGADKHGRFPATESLAYKHDFILNPVVDQWLVYFKQVLQAFYPNILLKQDHYEVQPTIDIDNPWCYKNKGLYRHVGGLLRDMLKSQWTLVGDRLRVLMGLQNDPHFVFDYLHAFFAAHEVKPIFFLHVGVYGDYDKSIAFSNRNFRLFLSKLCYENAWGIHPSYQAASNNKHLEKEINRLQKISANTVERSRHHYLKIALPHSYKSLIANGIKHDYTMGFADNVGFRAGTSRPFYFYDLSTEEATNLQVHPFVLMDGTLKNYQQIPANEVLKQIETLVDAIKKVEGKFVSLWHNESLSDYGEWKGWITIYEKMTALSLK